MIPEKRRLIHSLLDGEEEARRESILCNSRPILKRRRQRRVALRSLTAIAIFGLAAFSIQRLIAPKPAVLTPVPPLTAQMRGLTDDELLALFPDTPVGLVTLPDGKKRLIFPRAGDKERFTAKAF